MRSGGAESKPSTTADSCQTLDPSQPMLSLQEAFSSRGHEKSLPFAFHNQQINTKKKNMEKSKQSHEADGGLGGAGSGQASPTADYEENQLDNSQPFKHGAYCGPDRQAWPWAARPYFFRQYTLGDFDIGRVLMKGQYGTVYLARDYRTRDLVMVKAAYKDKLLEEQVLYLLRKELEMQGYFDHPNILSLLGFFSDEARIYIVFEYCEHGTLEQYQRTLPGCRLEEPLAAKMTLDITSALIYLHDFNLMLRDIRPQSILVTKDLTAKLGDFAFAVYTVGPLQTEPRTTPAYEAPEFFLDLPISRLADNWQLGCLIYDMLTGDCAFAPPQSVDANDHVAIYPGVGQNVINLSYESHRCTSKLAGDLMKKLMMRDAELRLPLDQVVVHPWILLHTSYSPDKPKPPKPISRTMQMDGGKSDKDGVFVEDCVGASQQIRVEAETHGGMQETRQSRTEYFEHENRDQLHPCHKPDFGN